MPNTLINLNNHINYVQQNYSTSINYIVGNFLYGSQNYGLSTNNSDTDSILVYDGDKIKCSPHNSIRVGIEDIKLLNIEMFCNKLSHLFLPVLEVFCTEYKNVENSKLLKLFNDFSIDEFCNNQKELLLTNLNKKLAEHTNEINHLGFFERPDDLFYNKKRLYWAMRVYEQIERIENGEPFSITLISNQQEQLLNIKNGVKIPLRDVVDFRTKAFDKIKELNMLRPADSDQNKNILNNFKTSLYKTIEESKLCH